MILNLPKSPWDDFWDDFDDFYAISRSIINKAQPSDNSIVP